jgi:hypothetical protein
MAQDNLPHDLPKAVLAEVADLAAARGWASVTTFTGSLPAPGDRSITIIAAPEADAGPLAAWLGGLGDEARVAPAGLDGITADPAPALIANRVLVALRAGELLMPETVEGAAMVAQRPAPSYLIVVTGAEEIRSREDLDAVERGLWRVLLGRDGEEWRGQDISARHCLLWSAGLPDGWLAERVTRDAGKLRAWAAGPVEVSGTLTRDRALCAIWLGVSEAERPARAADLAAEVRGLHARLLSRLEADAATTERQVVASLRILKQDLLLAMSSGAAGRGADVVTQAVREWEFETARTLRQRSMDTDKQADELLDHVDWMLINELAPHPAGDSYPKAILWHLLPQPSSLPTGDWREVTSAGPGRAAPDWTSALRAGSGGALIAAGVAAAALVFLGLPLVPAAGVAAVGAIGGSLYQRHHTDEMLRNQQQADGRRQIETASANAVTAVREALAEQAAVIRDAVDGEFSGLEYALDARASATDMAGTSAAQEPGDPSTARLHSLGGQLAAWTPEPTEIADTGEQ